MPLRFSRFIQVFCAVFTGIICVAVCGRAAESSLNLNQEVLTALGYNSLLIERWQKDRPDLVAMIIAAVQQDDRRLQRILDDLFPMENRTDRDIKWLNEMRLDPTPVTVYRGFTGHPRNYDSKNSVFSMVDSPNEMYVSPDFTYAMRYATKFAVSAEPVTLIVAMQVPRFLYHEKRDSAGAREGVVLFPFVQDTDDFTLRRGWIDRLVADWLSSERSEGIKWEAPHAARPFNCETLFSN